MPDKIPPHLTRMLKRELEPGECVVWQAQPGSDRLVRRHHWSVTCFGILWLCFLTPFVLYIVFHEWSPMPPDTSESPLFRWLELAFKWAFALLWCGISLLVCGAAIFGRFWARKSEQNHLYVITDRRAILIKGVWLDEKVRSFSGEQLLQAERLAEPDGGGDIIFARETFPPDEKSEMPCPPPHDIGFLGLANLDLVDRQLRALHARTLPESTGEAGA